MSADITAPRVDVNGASDTGNEGGPAAEAREQARQHADDARNAAQQAAGKAQDKLREQLDQRSTQAADQINQQASDLRSVSEKLREHGTDAPAKVADRAADYAERVGGYLKDADPDRLLRDAEDFGRRQPWAVAVGGLALGFAASRFLKASSARRYGSQSPQSPAPSPQPATQPGPSSTPPVGPTSPAMSVPPATSVPPAVDPVGPSLPDRPVI
jgi:gas vesicle protein